MVSLLLRNKEDRAVFLLLALKLSSLQHFLNDRNISRMSCIDVISCHIARYLGQKNSGVWFRVEVKGEDVATNRNVVG